VVSVVPELVADVLEQARRHEVAAAVLGEATADDGAAALVIDGPNGPIVDVALADAAHAWRDAIPTALGLGALGVTALGSGRPG
jgi:hypothetical protein